MAKGKGILWGLPESLALYKILRANPSGNDRIVRELFEAGQGKFPQRTSQQLANVKYSKFGYDVRGATVDPTVASKPFREDSGFWQQTGLTHPGYSTRPPEGNTNARRPVEPEDKAKAIADYYAGVSMQELRERLGVSGGDTIGRWVREDRAQKQGKQAQQELKLVRAMSNKPDPKPVLELPPPPPPIAPAATPTTIVTFDDGAGMKFSLTIEEHISTVVAKVAELSQQ